MSRTYESQPKWFVYETENATLAVDGSIIAGKQQVLKVGVVDLFDTTFPDPSAVPLIRQGRLEQYEKP